jgi:aryl-alcohol dehydrogenase-like predicted oxidoreductase
VLQVSAVGELIKAGKIKYWGLSNETAYGVTRMCETAKKLGVPLPITIQNDYSICDRFSLLLLRSCSAHDLCFL